MLYEYPEILRQIKHKLIIYYIVEKHLFYKLTTQDWIIPK